MARSLYVSQSYVSHVKAVIKQQGFLSQSALANEAAMARATVNKFLNGKPVDTANFRDLCDLLKLDYLEVSNLAQEPPQEQSEDEGDRFPIRVWNDAPDIVLEGHLAEKQILKQWLSDNSCRIITVTGIAQVGKTFLSSQVAREMAEHFDIVIWVSLKQRPKPKELLDYLIRVILGQDVCAEKDLQTTVDTFMSCLRNQRCLIILNRLELLIQPGEGLGNLESGYTELGSILRRIGEQDHQSHILLVSREPLKDLLTYSGNNRPIRQLPIGGLTLEEARYVLHQEGVSGFPEKQDELIHLYGAHPYFLHIVSKHIKQLSEGDIGKFLADEKAPVVFNGVLENLNKIFERVSKNEHSLINWMAIYPVPVTEHILQNLIRFSPEKRRNTLLALRRRSFIDLEKNQYCIQPYIRKYLILQLKERIIEEIKSGKIDHFNQYPLIVLNADDQAQNHQKKFIVQPLINALLLYYGARKLLEERLIEILDLLRAPPRNRPGYAAANILVLLKLLQPKNHTQEQPILIGHNFSALPIKQADLRGARLHNLNFAHTDLSQSVFYESFGGILTIALSQDGQWLAAGDASHNVYVWKMKENQFIFHRKYAGHTHWVRTVMISPTGQYIASGSEDHTLRVWDLENGETIAVLKGYDRRIRSLAFSDDGKYLASAGDDATVVLWDTQTWERLSTYTGELGARFREVVFDSTGRFLIAAKQNSHIHFWDLRRDMALQHPQAILCQETQEDALVRTIALHPDGHILASGGDDGTVKLWRFPTGDFVRQLPGQAGWIRKIIFSADGSLIACSHEDGKVHVWNVATSELQHDFDEHKGRVWEIVFSPDAKTIITGSDDQYIKLLDLQTNQCLAHLQGYTCKLRSVVFSPDGQWLASSGDDRVIRIWEVDSEKCIKQLAGHGGRVWSLAFCQLPSGKQYLISGSDDKTVKVWNLESLQCVRTFKEHTSWVRAVSGDWDHSWIVSGGDDKCLRAFSLETFQARSFNAAHQDWIVSVAVSPDGRLAISGSDDRTVKIWEVETGNLIDTIHGHERAVKAVAISPDGKYFATGCRDKIVRLFTLVDGTLLNQSHKILQNMQGHDDWVRCVSFHPHQAILASGGYDQKAILWDYITGKPIRILRGHGGAVISVAFNPGGDTLATGSEDGTIKFWTVKTGKLIKTIPMPKPYQGLNITGVTGVSREQRMKLLELGAVEEMEE